MTVGGAMGALLGVGSTGDRLQKLTIAYQRPFADEERIEALFNPNEITRSRTVDWEPRKALRGGSRRDEVITGQHFTGVQPETLTVVLFFDSYESRTQPSSPLATLAGLAVPAGPLTPSTAFDVTTLTNKVAALARIDRILRRPPTCHLSWGSQKEIFSGVLTQLDQQFSMFLPDGTPVRATLTCSFREAATTSQAGAGASTVDRLVVGSGDSLATIALATLGSPARWREIAKVNGITDPRRLRPGQVLNIPVASGG